MGGYLMDLGGWENFWEEEEMRLGKDYWAESEMEKTSILTYTRLCPNCNEEFLSIEAVILHLDSQSTCWPHESCPQQFPISPGLQGSRSSASSTTGSYHPQSGLQEDQYEYRRKINTYYPFHDEGEWELARFLVENLTQTQIDKFLKLKWFHTRPRPSFTSKDQLRDWIDALPSFVPWKVSTMEFTGYKMTYPLQLIWRDAFEVVKQLFSDPIFANHITFQPHVVNTGGQHEYGDYMSADMAWKIQVNSILGATQVPIILGSDKTPVTRTTGGLEMHPLFITIGNLDSEVRSKATLRAWHCIAYMPIANFCVHPDYQSILQARLWHRCVDLVCANLKVAAKDGCFMPDPSRYICYVFTPLVSHVCDLPEATMIATVSKSASLITMATQANFGDGVLYPPHTGQHTLQLIYEISKEVDPWDLDKFQKAAKAVHLSGVHMPYWRDWTFAYPSVFLTGEVLQTCIKFFADHLLNWIKEIVGKPELNTHFMVQHKRVGTCHFAKGVTHVNQMTGRKHRDIQCTIVASIAGAAPPRFICSICALIEFIYLSQNLVHSPDSLQSMAQALSDFNSFKDAIVDTEARRGKKGVRDNFFILKLKLLQSFRGMCVRILNRQESMELFNLYALFYSCGTSLVNAIHIEDEEVMTINTALSWISRVLPDETHSVHGPRPVWNHFLKGILSGDALTAFHLTSTLDFNALTPITIEAKYSLVDFNHALSQFINQLSLSTGEHTRWDHGYGHFCTWNQFRLQLHSAFQPRVIVPSRVIQAYPPSDAFPLGNCDTVLINVTGGDGQSTSRVAQVRLIFQPKIPQASDLVLPMYLSSPLLYVQFFHFITNPNDHPELAMWTVERTYMIDQCGRHYVTHTVELIPEYGNKVDERISSATSLESYDRFFLNSFADKESYHTFLAQSSHRPSISSSYYY
ncbi:uncharacterized protein F5891DRAFT_975993 [Suillus fuscotomentosus]|uniref:DUF6830 domain-containing protein n=1 Tax=Suillus fuscotomentosus TaxID=1912939 RepID=A0AAD4EGX4_9AGAM|nr:uncharacterized protein F5891DRAFT_975993 [Suillus fuscotomentosus]KAG1905852.1 hypothetical protein F5891DRAFT_975993 [Suillus fuscotomentosus]